MTSQRRRKSLYILANGRQQRLPVRSAVSSRIGIIWTLQMRVRYTVQTVGITYDRTLTSQPKSPALPDALGNSRERSLF
jgi:hypothetical protein